VIATGLPASLGAASSEVVFSSDEAEVRSSPFASQKPRTRRLGISDWKFTYYRLDKPPGVTEALKQYPYDSPLEPQA
jgi:hypothetical protein